MKTAWVYVIVALGLLLAGFGAGWQFKAGRVAIKTVTVQDQTILEQNKALQARLDAEQSAKNTTEQALTTERDRSAKLNVDLGNAEATLADLQDHIHHAPLDSPRPLPVAGTCPGNPLAGNDFSLLYEQAARGAAAGPYGDLAHPSGVPALSH